tara:strand:- start:439 stop:708 length:270 start_codon:yes stop_codon:yes gene_type:complete
MTDITYNINLLEDSPDSFAKVLNSIKDQLTQEQGKPLSYREALKELIPDNMERIEKSNNPAELAVLYLLVSFAAVPKLRKETKKLGKLK